MPPWASTASSPREANSGICLLELEGCQKEQCSQSTCPCPLLVNFQRDVGRHQEELPGATGLQAGQEVAQVPSALPEEPLPATPPPRPSPLHPRPYAPSLEPVAATVVEADVDPVDVRPMGLECFPPRPGGFRPLGFCMAVPLGGHGRSVPVTCSPPWSLTCGQTTGGTTSYHQMTSHPWPLKQRP